MNSLRLFGTAGVRGIFNKTQSASFILHLARAATSCFGTGKYATGWDSRKTSVLLAKAISSGVSIEGGNCILLGLVPTPVIAYSTRRYTCKLGFAVTASHNPPQFSGVKIFDHRGMELAEQDERKIEEFFASYSTQPAKSFGEITEDQFACQDYINNMVDRFEGKKCGLKIAIDCANGPTGRVTPSLLTLLGHKVISFNSQSSWRFPAHQPEPTETNLAKFAKIVEFLGVDVGLAHDGDGDRLVLIDPSGVVLPHSIPAILALKSLERTSGSVVLSENTSSAVEEEAERIGLKVIRARVGKTFTMLENHGGVLALEPSKITDIRWGLWEDGIYAAVLISSVLSSEPNILRELVRSNRWHYKQISLELSISFPRLIDIAEKTFRRMGMAEERRLDGYKVILDDGSWIMFRQSGTEPKVRIYCESRYPRVLSTLIKEGIRCVKYASHN